MAQQQITVHRIGDQFEAYTTTGERITNRAILEQIAFEPMPGIRGTFTVTVDIDESATLSAGIQTAYINIRTQR